MELTRAVGLSRVTIGRQAGRHTMRFIIRNLKTNKTETLVRDVCHEHSEWVHEQLGTKSESDLQHAMDNMYESEYLGGGEDDCGVSLVEN